MLSWGCLAPVKRQFSTTVKPVSSPPAELWSDEEPERATQKNLPVESSDSRVTSKTNRKKKTKKMVDKTSDTGVSSSRLASYGI